MRKDRIDLALYVTFIDLDHYFSLVLLVKYGHNILCRLDNKKPYIVCLWVNLWIC